MPASHERLDACPYALGDGRRGQALLLHGLTGSPWDLRPIADSLADAGFRAHVPRLAGHRDVDALERSTRTQWLASAREALLALDRPRVVVGLSMGGLLGLSLAAERPGEIDGLAVLAVPLQTEGWKIEAARVLARMRAIAPLRGLVGRHRKSRVDVRVRSIAERSPGIDRFPYSSIAELGALQREVRASLHLVRAPMLVLHGRFDHAAPVGDSVRLAQSVSSPRVERVVLAESYHLLPRDIDGARVCAEVRRFADRIADDWAAAQRVVARTTSVRA